MGSDKVFIVAIWSMLFRYLLKCIEFVSYNYHVFIAYISIGKRGPVIMCGFESFLLTHKQ